MRSVTLLAQQSLRRRTGRYKRATYMCEMKPFSGWQDNEWVLNVCAY